MAQKKNNQKKAVAEESMLNKIAGDAAYMAGKVVVAKNNLVEMAGSAIETVKTTIQNIAPKKNTAPKKAVKAAVKKVVKKAVPVKKIAQKAAPAKKAVKAAVKKVVKKAAPAKKIIKKTAKKAVKKIARKR